MRLYRTTGLLDLKQADRRKIVFVGMGSLGSHILSNLSYPWGKIVLIDDEPLAEENIERHILGLNWKGKPKVYGMGHWLQDRGVEAKRIILHYERVEDVLLRHQDADLVIVTTGSATRACEYVNRNVDCPVLYSIVYPFGAGGEVTAVTNPRDICYICAEQMLGRWNNPEASNPNYGVAELASRGPLHAVPILRWPINQVAAQCARLALDILQRGDVKPHVLVQANSWQKILSVQSRSRAYYALASMVFAQRRLGLIRHFKLDRNGGRFELKVRNSQVALPLSRWSSCPLHPTKKSYSLEEI